MRVDEHRAVTYFREYLRIKSVQPEPDYDGCLQFLTRHASRLGLDYHVTELVAGKPIFIMTWPGLQPELPAILLNSHTDVVKSLIHWASAEVTFSTTTPYHTELEL